MPDTTGTFQPSHHAIERYRQRVAPGLSYGQARKALTQLARNARPLKITCAVRR